MNDETDLLKLFKALKASVRGSERHLLVGIDIAKNKHHAFFGTSNGRTLRKNFGGGGPGVDMLSLVMQK